MVFSRVGNIFNPPINNMQAKLLVIPLQNARMSDGKSSPDKRKGKVWMPSWTAKTKQHAVNNETHFKIARILSSPKKKEEEYSIRFNTHCPYSKAFISIN